MLKKIFLGSLFTGLIGILVIGGIIRTQSKLNQVAETAVSNQPAAAHENDKQRGTAVSDWQTTPATVTNVRSQGLWLQLPDGSTTRIRKQPWTYAQSQGFTAQVGDRLSLTGYAQEGGFEVCVIENTTSGQLVQLRDENGRSLWNTHTK